MPRERGRRKAELSVTPGFFICATPASMPEPSPRWNWMSGERACLSAYQKPPVSNSVEVTGPVLNRRYWRPAQTVRCKARDAVVGVVAGAFADGVEVEVVLQVAPDAGKIVNDRQRRRAFSASAGPMPESCKQARRADGAAADDDLAVGAQDLAAAA